jgi:hypothetical protein
VARKIAATATREPPSNNPFDALHQIPENMDAPQVPPMAEALHGNTKGKMVETPVLEKIPPIPTSSTKDDEPLDLEDGDAEMDLDEQDLAGIDLEHLEQAYHHQQLYTIPPDQLRKVHKVFLNSSAGSTTRSSSGLGIQGSQLKEQCKTQKDEKKRGRKSTQKLIQEIGHFMVNSGQIHLISDSFPPLPSPSSS